jgi:hypothetical protein
MGSSAFANPELLAPFLGSTDAKGVLFAAARDAAVRSMPEARPVARGRPVSAYVEAHIEQGPVLEVSGCKLGVVTGIQDVRWFEITITGSSAHAGTTPLDTRRDALMTAARVVAHLGEMVQVREGPALRLTVGRIELAPGSINTIADRVRLVAPRSWCSKVLGALIAAHEARRSGCNSRPCYPDHAGSRPARWRDGVGACLLCSDRQQPIVRGASALMLTSIEFRIQ